MKMDLKQAMQTRYFDGGVSPWDTQEVHVDNARLDVLWEESDAAAPLITSLNPQVTGSAITLRVGSQGEEPIGALMVDWGDGTTSNIAAAPFDTANHEYIVPGIYTIRAKLVAPGKTAGREFVETVMIVDPAPQAVSMLTSLFQSKLEAAIVPDTTKAEVVSIQAGAASPTGVPNAVVTRAWPVPDWFGYSCTKPISAGEYVAGWEASVAGDYRLVSRTNKWDATAGVTDFFVPAPCKIEFVDVISVTEGGRSLTIFADDQVCARIRTAELTAALGSLSGVTEFRVTLYVKRPCRIRTVGTSNRRLHSIVRQADVMPTPTPLEPIVMVVGDSLSEGATSMSAPTQWEWQCILSKYYNIYRCAIGGTGYTTTPNANERTFEQRYVADIINCSVPLAGLIVSYGYNDASSWIADKAGWTAKVKTIMTAIRTKYPMMPIAMIGPYCRTNSSNYNNYRNMETALEGVATSIGALMISPAREGWINDAARPLVINTDNVHFTEYGQRFIAAHNAARLQLGGFFDVVTD